MREDQGVGDIGEVHISLRTLAQLPGMISEYSEEKKKDLISIKK